MKGQVMPTRTEILLEQFFPKILEFCQKAGIMEPAKTFGENNVKMMCLSRLIEAWAAYMQDKAREPEGSEKEEAVEEEFCTCEEPMLDGEAEDSDGTIECICSLCGLRVREESEEEKKEAKQ